MDWMNLMQAFGLPVTILFAVGLGLWRVIVWAGREIAIPLRDRVIVRMEQFLDRLDTALREISESFAILRESAERQNRILRHIEQKIGDLVERNGEHGKAAP